MNTSRGARAFPPVSATPMPGGRRRRVMLLSARAAPIDRRIVLLGSSGGLELLFSLLLFDSGCDFSYGSFTLPTG